MSLFLLLLSFLHLLHQVYSQRCGGILNAGSADSGFITSPGYPDHYPEDLTCVWNIQAPLNEKIELHFWDFDVTGSDDCKGDYISIRGVDTSRQEDDATELHRQEENGGREKRYCGSKNPGIVHSLGDSLEIIFNSNAKGSCRGFNATYIVKEERITCGTTTSAQEFTFMSPNYPDTLANTSLQCSVTVDHGCDSPICQLRLDFDEFELQPPFWGECAYDRFYAESSTPLPFLCGSNNDTHKGDVTVALYNYRDSDLIHFPTRRAWNIRVTQIPCDCPKVRVPKAPVGCLQYHQGLTGEIKSFNFDGIGCYSEDRWCDFNAITHVSDCDIRVGYTGHYNNLDYSICVEPESGFCGIQYQQTSADAFSLSNITSFTNDPTTLHAQVADAGCMSDYVWVPGAENDHSTDTHERFCGTKLGNARKWGTVTSFSKPFSLRIVTDADEFSQEADYMNRGFQLSYSQIPCKLSG